VWSNRLGALPLFAGIRPEADRSGWQNVAAAGWCLGATTVLRGATKLRGGSVVRVRPMADRLEIDHVETAARARIASLREMSTEEAADAAAAAALECAADVGKLWSAPIAVDLSGGRDSRIAAAAALAAGLEAVFQTVDAEPGELEIATKLVRTAGRPLSHVTLASRPTVEETLPERLRLLHRHHDGMLDPRHSSSAPIEPLHTGYAGPAISGHGGELGYGFYYQSRTQLRNLRGKGMTRMVRRLMLLARRGGAARPDAYRAYRGEVERTLAEGQSLGLSGPRLLDYFCLAERLPNHSALGERSDRYSACCTPQFLRAGLDLRPGDRRDLALHHAVIARLAPQWQAIPFFTGARTELNGTRSWEREPDAAWLERVVFGDESWHDLYDPDAVRQRWRDARAGLGTAHHERLFTRIAWRASFEEHLGLLARRAAAPPLLG
jgi:hypothetical protein